MLPQMMGSAGAEEWLGSAPFGRHGSCITTEPYLCQHFPSEVLENGGISLPAWHNSRALLILTSFTAEVGQI